MKKLMQLSSLHLFVILLATSCAGLSSDFHDNEKELIAEINDPSTNEERLEKASKDITNTDFFSKVLVHAVEQNNIEAVRFLLGKIDPKIKEKIGKKTFKLIGNNKEDVDMPGIQADTIVVVVNTVNINIQGAEADTIVVIGNTGRINMQGAKADIIICRHNTGHINMQDAKATDVDMVKNGGTVNAQGITIGDESGSVDSDEF